MLARHVRWSASMAPEIDRHGLPGDLPHVDPLDHL
jgi:hypothetical protein